MIVVFEQNFDEQNQLIFYQLFYDYYGVIFYLGFVDLIMNLKCAKMKLLSKIWCQ